MEATQTTPPPDRTRRRPIKQDRPSHAGKTKICARMSIGDHARPITIWADKRHGGDLQKEIAQLRAVVTRLNNSPKHPGHVEWAAIYDCSAQRFGPEILTYKQNSWHDVGN